MRKVVLLFFLLCQFTGALDRQPNSDYRMRRQALAGKVNGGAVLLFASNEAEGPNDLYGYRPEDNFFYLSGWAEPGARCSSFWRARLTGPIQKSCSFPTTILPRKNGLDPKLGAGQSRRGQDNWIRSCRNPR